MRNQVRFLVAACLLCASAPALAKAPQMPTFETVKELVNRHFSTLADYHDGDLLSLSTVEPIFDALSEIGWKPSDIEQVYDNFLFDNTYFVTTMRSNSGRTFMRELANYPDVYGRLERISWLPRGQRFLNELIDNPKRKEVLPFLASEEGARALEKQFAGDSRARNFDLPTGHIYTAKQFLTELEQSHAKAIRGKARGGRTAVVQ